MKIDNIVYCGMATEYIFSSSILDSLKSVNKVWLKREKHP